MMTFTLMLAFAALQLAASGQAPGRCALVSTADASAAVGSSIASLKTAPQGSGTACSYETGHVGHSLLFTVYETSSREEAAVTLEQDVQSNARYYVQPAHTIAHLGDAAWSLGHVLWVRRGRVVFAINVIDASVLGETLGRAKSLARKAIARIDASAP